MKSIFLATLFIGLILSTQAQKNESIHDFNYLVQKIVDDYPGYGAKVTDKTKPQLKKLEEDIRRKIAIYPDSCGKYFSQYASWFRDNHLRVRRLRSSKSSSQKGEDNRQFFPLSPDKMKKSGTQSIEGLWFGFGGDIAVMQNEPGNEFIGIAVDYKDYEKDQIIFKLSYKEKNVYSMVYYPGYNNFKPVDGMASLMMDNKVLELHENTRFVRKTDSETFDKAFLYSYIPEFPNGRNTYPVAINLSDSTFYLRIPSFGSDYAEKLTKSYWKEITTRPNLIIDIRNNGGGQDNYYQVLSELIYTQPYESKGVEWYATKNNIKMFEDALKNGEIQNGEEGIKWTNALLKEMKKNIGGFVMHPMMGGDGTIKNDTIYYYPKRIGIIINEGNASSAEQFLLSAKQSSKVILFGNANTAGVLDYSNAISENFPSDKFELIFPMTRSRRLPEHPIDNIGIAPEIYIPFPSTEQLYDRIDNWVYFVKDYLEMPERN